MAKNLSLEPHEDFITDEVIGARWSMLEWPSFVVNSSCHIKVSCELQALGVTQ
jgi:hypothetical protein